MGHVSRPQNPLQPAAVFVNGSFDSEGAITFGPVRTAPVLVDSAVQASLMRYPRGDRGQGRSRLLFSNPAHPRDRVNLTVRLSYDEGRTWPVAKTADLGPAAYSDLVIQDDGCMGLLYERGNQGGIAYVRFSLEWLTAGRDC